MLFAAEAVSYCLLRRFGLRLPKEGGEFVADYAGTIGAAPCPALDRAQARQLAPLDLVCEDPLWCLRPAPGGTLPRPTKRQALIRAAREGGPDERVEIPA